MGTRLVLCFLAAFWVVMNLLLWRAEYGKGGMGTGTVPSSVVIDRILTAPDPSTMRVYMDDQEVGILRWMPTVLEDRVPDLASDMEGPEGMVRETLGYRLEMDYTHHAELPSDRWRMMLHLDLDAERSLKEAQFRLNQRPLVWEMDASAASGKVEFRLTDGSVAQFEQSFQLKDLDNLPSMLGTYSALLPRRFRPQQLPRFDSSSLEPMLSAHQERLAVGQHSLRVFRLNVRLFDNQESVWHISRAGELLKVELPKGIVLINQDVPKLR